MQSAHGPRRIGNNGVVTIVHEQSWVPPLDVAALRTLSHAFDRDGVVSAMVIGSQARGTAGPLSDIDIAYWHETELNPKARTSLRLQLVAAASTALGTDEIDVVPLNHASPLLRQRAVRDGNRFIERDAKARVRFEARAIIEYLDTEPLRAVLSRGLRKRIREDRFGRRRQH